MNQIIRQVACSSNSISSYQYVVCYYLSPSLYMLTQFCTQQLNHERTHQWLHFQPALNTFKKSFNQHIGLPFLLGLCIFYCIFSPSSYWLVPILLLKGGFKQMWTASQIYIVANRLRSICLKNKTSLAAKNVDFKAALKGTKFDSNKFNLFPTLTDAIFILIMIKEYSVAQQLIEANLKDKDIFSQQLGLIKQYLSKCQINAKVTVPQDVVIFRKNLESFIVDICRNMLKNNDTFTPQKCKIPQKWFNQMMNHASTGKKTCQLQVCHKEIVNAAHQNQRISPNELFYSIPYESSQQFYNLFTRKMNFPQSTRGLANIGNTCYMNSALQCLHKTFELTASIKQSQIRPTPFVQAYLQLMQELSRKEERPFAPKTIKKLIGQYDPLFDDYAQHDSSQLLATVLNHLNDDLNRVSVKGKYKIDTIKRNNDQLLEQYIKKDHTQCQSIIQDLFFGRYFTTYRCRMCKNELKLFQKFNILYLPVPTKGKLTLTACMKEFTKPDVMSDDNAWWCSNCEKNTETDKYISVYQNSPILIICFKRFTLNRKITQHIHFDKEITLEDISSNRKIQKATYDLYGVINHKGHSIHYGHYYSFCKDGPVWRKYDDSRVSQVVDEEDIVTDDAFILLYCIRKQ